tara:strand:+ start:1788 stop:2636 length:849 start_codon:yes stop_codon:yes gene_type:complete
MKSLVIITTFLLGFSVYGQRSPQITFASPDLIQGFGEIGTTIEISIDADFVSEYQISINDSVNFQFKFKFPKPLNIGDNIIVWSVNSKKEFSQRIVVKIEDPSLILETSSNTKLNYENFTDNTVAGKTVSYKATIWNTNFSIPLARFNFMLKEDRKAGDLVLFNSIGAGFGISAGELSETRDFQGNLINQEFINTFGIHLGFLFSAGTGDDTKNVFAPTLNFSILDFQLGVGYELGTLSENQQPTFMTLSYAIPLYKLKKGGFWIWKGSKPITGPSSSRLGG